MNKNKFGIRDYILPLGLLLAAVIYIIFLLSRFAFDFLSCIPGFTAIVCSLTALYIIRENKFHINRFFFAYFLANAAGMLGVILLFAGVQHFDPLIMFFSVQIIIPLSLVAEWLVLSQKTANKAEICVMIIISPIFHFYGLFLYLAFMSFFVEY